MNSNYRLSLLALLIIVFSGTAISQTTKGRINSGTKTESSIRKAEVHQYELELEADHAVFIDLIQNGVDLVLKVLGPDSLELESDFYDKGEEVLLLQSEETASYTILVSVFEQKGSGQYELIIGKKMDLPAAKKDRLQKLIAHWNDRNYLPGFGVAIVTGDQVLLQEGYGYADVASKRPYTPATIQNIGSVSKTTIGLSLMKLVDQGKLDLDTPVNDILPFKVNNHWHPDAPITVRHLATHTSAINDGPLYDYSYVLLEEREYEKDELEKYERRALKQYSGNERAELAQFVQDVLSSEGKSYYKNTYFKRLPGKQYYYSNIAAGLAAHIVEVISGMSYPAFTNKHIFEPLGMKATGWTFDDVDMTKHASLYFSNNKTTIPRYTLNTYPDGGLLTSIEDLSSYLQELIKGAGGKGSILTNSAFNEMMRPQLKPSHFNRTEDGANAGLFWEIRKDGTEGHSGGDPGIVTRMFFSREQNVGAVIFTNSGLDNLLARAQFTAIWNLLMKYGPEMADGQ